MPRCSSHAGPCATMAPASSLLCAPSPLSQFEKERLDRIAENRRRLEAMGVLDTARDLVKVFRPAPVARPIAKATRRPREKRRAGPRRRSPRLEGVAVVHREMKTDLEAVDSPQRGSRREVSYVSYDGGLDDILADGADMDTLPLEKQEAFQELRCGSVARGSVYDSFAGITCHFCRQKKLCGEEGCPRCSRRNMKAQCLGKTECSRCGSATGRFCRACLLIRYGQKMEVAQAEMAAGKWLCPHCYEDEHPDEGWMCNSSICMKRRGFKPTGIAIFDAQARGFSSVAHWLQSQLRRRGATAMCSSDACGAAAPCGGKIAATTSGSSGSCDGAGDKDNCRRVTRRAAATKGSASPASSSGASAAALAPRTPTRGSEAREGKSATPSNASRASSVIEGEAGGARGARRSLRFKRS